jgi:tRNA(adenine34) deaminase
MDKTPSINDETFMRAALVEAKAALKRGDRPIGAVIVHKGQIIGRGSNTFSSGKNDIAHAEINAINSCSAHLQEQGPECTIYTTCEPCVMCLGAIVMANIREIVYGMPDNYIQAQLVIDAVPYIKKRVSRYVGGVLQADCVALFRRFSEKEADACLMGKINNAA